jgi:hypothetical protein
MNGPVDDRLERLGWRGIGAPGVSWISDDPDNDDFASTGWIAIATDPDSGEIAVSVWTGEGISKRRLAFWMPRESAAKFAEAITSELDA